MIEMADCRLSPAEKAAVNAVLDSGRYIQGERVKEFEAAFAEFVGASYAVACSSGTTALHLALLAAGVGPGDEVLVPAFTFFATASQVVACGATPVFCDIDPHTWLIDLDDAFQKVTPRTRAIVPVHIFGNVVGSLSLKNFRRMGIMVIYDAAQAAGSLWHNDPIGGFADMTCYSVFPSKNLFGPGEGGVVVSNCGLSSTLMRRMRAHGSIVKYYHERMGYNYRMSEMMAAALRVQLSMRAKQNVLSRRSHASDLRSTLDGVDGLTYQRITPVSTHSYNQFCIVVDKDRYGLSRDELGQALQHQGINTAIHYPCGLHRQPAFAPYVSHAHLPVTDDICSRILAIPVHHGLSVQDVDTICQALIDAPNMLEKAHNES